MSKKDKNRQRELLTPTGRVKQRAVVYDNNEPMGHGTRITHSGHQYRLLEVLPIDCKRFPDAWPKPGWYWERGPWGTVARDAVGGPFKTPRAAKLDIERH